MKSKIKIVMLLLVLISLCGCGKTGKQTQEVTQEPINPQYTVNLEVVCVGNLLFSKYDLELQMDGERLGVLDHGKTDTYTVELDEGKHSFKTENEEDSTVDGSVDFQVNKDSNVKFVLSCTSDQVEIKMISEVNPPLDFEEVVGQNYETVKAEFVDAGFENVSEKEVKDLSPDKSDQVGQVANVVIDEGKPFDKTDMFLTDVTIVVEYHAQADITMQTNSYTYEDKNYEEVENEMKNMGFTNIKSEACTGYSDIANGVLSIEIDGWSFDKGDTFNPNDKVVIKYNVVDSESETETSDKDSSGRSATSLSDYFAKQAFEDYGKLNYPYGFKCHWIMNLIANETMSDGSRYFKVGITITNAYGTKYDTIAEGIVSGTDISTDITAFYVSN